MNAGIATAARMPMIATTIISSMSVKPLCAFFVKRVSMTDDPPGLLSDVLFVDLGVDARAEVERVDARVVVEVALGEQVVPAVGRRREPELCCLGADVGAVAGGAGDGDVAAVQRGLRRLDVPRLPGRRD